MRSQMLLAALLVAPTLAAEGLAINGDGWHSWRVSTHNSTKDWCCFVSNAAQTIGTVCDLDGRRSGYTAADGARPSTGEMQIYALIENSRPQKIRTLSPDCPVKTASAIHDLGLVDTNISFEWLRDLASPHSDITMEALAAIAVHEGPKPRNELLRTALQDGNQDSREAAVFAISQLPTDAAVDTLTVVIEQRDLDIDTRRSALFWLAQSDSDRVVEYFSKLLASR